MRLGQIGSEPYPQDSSGGAAIADTQGNVTRRILSTALACAAVAAAVLGVPATADDPTPTATASSSPAAVETAPPAAPTQEPTQAPTQAPTEAPTSEPAQAPTETPTEAPTETPYPSPVETTISTPEPTAPAADPTAAATADATATATATATETPKKKKRTRAANTSTSKKGQARTCTEKDTGKASTSTSASGCVEIEEHDHDTRLPPLRRRVSRTPTAAPPRRNPSYALSTPGPAKIGVPNFFIDKFRIPPFLLPIYQAAGMQYGIRWEILAGINEIETDYGRNLNISSAGALGWMQFMPPTWKAYGVDANSDGVKDPFNPVDAIFAAARYLKAAGAETDIRKAVFAYNHADWYVDSVLMRAQVIGGIPGDLVGSLTGLTQGRFPVRAKATYAGAYKKADRKTAGNPAVTVESDETRRNIEIFAKAGSPVIAVNDGKVIKLGTSKRLGRYVVLQDVYGNTYTYANLGSVAKTYPTPKKRTSKKDSDTGAKRRGIEHEGTEDAKAAAKAAPATKPAEHRRPGRQGPPLRPPGAQERQGRGRRRPDHRRAHRGARLRRRPARPEPEGLRRQAARQGRPRPRRHHARPHRQDERDRRPAPAVRDPPGRPRRPAHRPEADPRRLEAARVDRGLPRQGQERAVRHRRRGARASARSC